VRSIFELALAHATEQVEVLFHAACAMRAVLAGLGQRAAMRADLLGTEIINVGLALLDQRDGELVELLEVVGCVELFIPLEAEPGDIGLDRVDILLLFLAGVGVVEAQVAQPVELLGQAEVGADRLGVADVQVAVGLGREAQMDATVVLSRRLVRGDARLDEVRRSFRLFSLVHAVPQ